MMQKKHRLNNRGFTLLELMISVVLLAVIISIAGIAMRLACRSVNAGEIRIDHLDRFRSSLSIVESQIQSGMPLIFTVEGERKSSFQGGKTSMQLATNHSIWHGQQGYVLVKYRVEADGHGKKTLYASESAIGTEHAREVKLFDNLDDLSFEYFFKEVTEEEGKWIDEWTQELFSPEKIKLNITYRAKKYSLVIPYRSAGMQVSSGAIPLVPKN